MTYRSAAEIHGPKRAPGRDLLAHGGARFAQSLVRTKLIDESSIPSSLVTASGYSPKAPDRLELADAMVFSTGVVAKILRRV